MKICMFIVMACASFATALVPPNADDFTISTLRNAAKACVEVVSFARSYVPHVEQPYV